MDRSSDRGSAGTGSAASYRVQKDAALNRADQLQAELDQAIRERNGHHKAAGKLGQDVVALERRLHELETENGELRAANGRLEQQLAAVQGWDGPDAWVPPTQPVPQP